MKKLTLRLLSPLALMVGLCFIATATIASRSQAQSTPARQTKRPLNEINPAFVVTPKEAIEWHALKAKGGPALSGNASWKNYMEFVEQKLKDYGAVDITRNAFNYDRWHTSEWPDDSKWSLTVEWKEGQSSQLRRLLGLNF